MSPFIAASQRPSTEHYADHTEGRALKIAPRIRVIMARSGQAFSLSTPWCWSSPELTSSWWRSGLSGSTRGTSGQWSTDATDAATVVHGSWPYHRALTRLVTCAPSMWHLTSTRPASGVTHQLTRVMGQNWPHLVASRVFSFAANATATVCH